MRHLSRAIAAFTLLLAVNVVGIPTAAAAVANCPTYQSGGNTFYDIDFDYEGGYYGPPSDNDLGGIRAPLQVVKNGAICKPNGFVASYISIERADDIGLVQMGWDHHYNAATDTGIFCKFWATGPGIANFYGCQPNDLVYVYFKIVKFFDSSQGAYFYDLQDCGASGYSSCTTKNSSQRHFQNERAGALQESPYGDGLVSSCAVDFMGASSERANIGTDANNLQVMGDYNGSWGTRTWNTTNGDCTHYDKSVTTNRVQTWDDRNS